MIVSIEHHFTKQHSLTKGLKCDMATDMNCLLCGWLLLAMVSPVSLQDVNEMIRTAAYNGTTATITCPGQVAFTLPKWTGPPVSSDGKFTVYTQDNDPIPNPILTRISYATDNRSLILDDTRLKDAGTYRCFKPEFAFIGDNIFSVQISPDQPEITASVVVDNKGVRATEGQELTVTCTSSGGFPEPTVAWYWGSTTGQPLVNISTGTQVGDTYTVKLNYTFTPTRKNDRQHLVCRSYWPTPADKQGSLEETVFLYLYLKPLQQSVIQTTSVEAGYDVTVQCRASGCRPAASIFWIYQGNMHTPNVTDIIVTANETFTTESVLRMHVTATDNGQTVLCRVSHMTLNVTVMTSLNVKFSVKSSSTIITGNGVIEANGANKLSLICTTGSSNPPAVITWRKGTDVITNTNAYTNATGENNGVIRSQTLTINPTRYDHGINITCLASNGVNQFTDNTMVTLTLHFTPIVTISTNSSVTLTEQPSQPPTVLSCSADSNPQAMLFWYHNGQSVNSGRLGSSLSYTIEEADRTSYGNYTCTASNNVPPGDSKTYTVNVLFRPLHVSIDKPAGGFIANGQKQMSILCTSGTSNPVSEITWIADKIQNTQTSHADNPGEYGGTVRTSTIRFNPTREHDGATVSCQAWNNVTGQHEVLNSTVIDNIIYNPLIADIPDSNVTEGKSVTLPCHASSKPPATFTWRKDSFDVTSGHGTVLYNGFNYTIHNTSRVHAGTYSCTADNRVQPSDNKQILLTVLYPPDVTVKAINKTANSIITTVTCEASGIPDKYTYERWEHTWNGRVVRHPEPLPATKILTLTNLSYAHSGVYKCGASNGVKNVSYGAGNLLVKSPPIVVGDVANRMEIKASGQLMKATTVTFQYYSNAGRGFVTVQKVNGTGEDVGDVQIRDVDISLPVFLSEINTSGTEATINISLKNMSQFGDYHVFVANEMDSIRLSLIIQPLGPPEPPVWINSTILDHQSVTIMWISGFPNGLNQTFVIQLGTDNSTWQNTTQFGGMAYQQTHSKTIDNLASSQLYFVRMLAINAMGESGISSTLSFITAASPDSPTLSSSIGLIAGGAAGGVVTAAVVIIVIIVVVRRLKADSMQGSSKDKGAFVMSSNRNEGYDNGDEEVINRLYESAGMTESVVGASTSQHVSHADVENIYTKVNKKPEVVYALPDKLTGKKMERQQNQKAMESRKDGKTKKEKGKIKSQTGDLYENTPSIMSDNKSAPQSGESVYEDTSISVPAVPKKSTGSDGLLYAVLEFAPKKKGPTKIIGIEDRCEYTTIDLTKKAQPLPDSDDECLTNT